MIGLALEHPLRVLFAKPTSAAIFLMINGLILLGAERLRRRVKARPPVPVAGAHAGDGPAADEAAELSAITFRDAVGIGFAQSTALIAGISRDGVCMSAGLLSGLDNETAARFAFLLATPIILAAGVVKLPDLTGPLGNGIRAQAAVACGCAAVTAVIAVHYLLRYFRTRTLIPFGLYCLAFGLAMAIYTTV